MVLRIAVLTLLLVMLEGSLPLAAPPQTEPSTSPAETTSGTTQTASPPLEAAQETGAPVVLGSDVVFLLQAPLVDFPAEERARIISDRLARITKDLSVLPDALQLAEIDKDITEIVLGERVIMAITNADARAAGLSRQDLARDYLQKIRRSITSARERASLKSVLLGVLYTVLATLAAWLGFTQVHKVFPRLYTTLASWRGTRIRDLRVGEVRLVSADLLTVVLLWAAKTIRVVLLLILAYAYLSTVFYVFPATRGVAETLLRYALAPLAWGEHVRGVLLDLLFGAVLTLIATALTYVAWVVIHYMHPRARRQVEAWRGTRIRSLKIQAVEVLSADRMTHTLLWLLDAARLVLLVLLVYAYTTSVLGFFPWTRGIAGKLLDYVLTPLVAIGHAFLTHLPNLFSIIVIIIVTRYLLKLIHLIFAGVGRGAIRFPGFYREWAGPTYRIVRFLVIAFAVVAAFPYIPGSDSAAFRGISVFLGILFSLGSAGAISNAVSGVILTYMRPFQIGDRVKIADTTGDIIGSELLVTRVRTIKNVHVTIPNAMVLSSHIINYTATSSEQQLILHTAVTIGYAAPWRKVHALLISAAGKTDGILPQPAPFVLQTSLNDFYVTYELNAYTDQPNRMAAIYSELHQQIQDAFNEAGVEIMSPHYTQIRDGNKTAIPDEYLPKTYQAPGLRLSPLSDLLRRGEPHTPSLPSE